MYIKITKNQAGQAYYHLVESYRDGGKVRQRTLLSLGKVGEDRLDELIAAIARHRDVASWVEMAKRISVEDTYILGPLLAVRQIFSRFGVDEVLSALVRAHPKLGFDLARIVFTLVVIRFIRPGSKLKVFEYWQEKLCPLYLSGKDELHQLYRALDVLALHKEAIEQRLFQRGAGFALAGGGCRTLRSDNAAFREYARRFGGITALWLLEGNAFGLHPGGVRASGRYGRDPPGL